MTTISDLSPELVDDILSRTPLTSLGAVRLTSKQWNSSSKERVVCKARARHQFLGFMKMGSSVCSVKFHDELDDLSINQVGKFNQFEISQIFHCNELLLCVSLDSKKLVIWNPYLNQTRIIKPTNPSLENHYGIGYDSCGRYKILRFLDCLTGKLEEWFKEQWVTEYEIYDFDSNSWRGLDVSPDWNIRPDRRGVSLKGSTYWIAQDSLNTEEWDEDEELHDHFLLRFDFTRERFGPRLKLPIKEYVDLAGTLPCVREEQLAVLFHQWDSYMMMEIWVTTKIEPEDVSWSKFFVFDMTPSQGIRKAVHQGSFCIDEDKKVAVLFDLKFLMHNNIPGCNIVYIIGEDGYYKEVYLERSSFRPIVCSYVPSLCANRATYKRQSEKR